MSVRPVTPILAALAALALTTAPATAQTDLDRALSGLSFREIGPAIMGGRVADLAPVESNPSVFYVGLATGGVWKTENQAMSWTPLFDDQPCSSIGDVTVYQANPNVVWVGTGEPQNRQSSPYGCGVFRSTDGGRSWTSAGLEATRHVGRIQLDPGDPDVAYVAAVGHLFGPNPERGVFKTTDGGQTWEKVLYIDENTGAIDLAMDPGDPNTLFAAMYQRRRRAFGFSASGGGSGLYRTTDGGRTWTELTEGLPEGDKGRIGVDIYRRDGNLVYALVESNRKGRGLYRSRDRGDSWEKVSDRNPRPMYFSQVRIDPNNPDRIYLGGVSMSASDDGGKTWWEGDAAEGIHVDHHALWIDPANSDHVLTGSDGGISSSWDGGKHWRHHNNLAIGQFYEIGVDMSEPYRVCGGLQDNSSWCAPNETDTGYGLMNRNWTDVWGGDGFYNRIDPTNPDIVYTESQGGFSGRVNLATGESKGVRPLARQSDAEPERSYRFNWNAPILVSQHDPSTIYVASNHLMRSRDQGRSWEEASPDLTRAIDRDSLTIMGELVTRETLSRHDGQSNYGTITNIDESPLDANVLWAGTDDGNLQVTRDGGASWTNVVGNVPDLGDRSYVSQVTASSHEAGRAYVTFDRHFDDDYRPYVYTTDDFGAHWSRITDGLPEWSVNAIAEHPHTPDLLFVGNEIGVFVSTDRGGSWHRMQGLPTVPVDDIVVHPRDDDLVLGTHGRSIWILDDLAPLESAARAPVFTEAAHLFPVPEATERFRLGGWPFWGDLYVAENPPDGAVIRYWLNEAAEDSVKLTVTDAAGGELRSLKPASDAGLHEVVWDLREDVPGVEPPAPGEGGRFFRAPRGPLALPGTYLVQLEVGDDVMQEEVTVVLDPRVQNPDRAALIARHDAARSAAILSGTQRQAQQAVRRLSGQLADAKKLIQAADADDALASEADSLRNELDSLGAEIGRAGVGRAAFGIERAAEAPSADELWAIDHAWETLPPLVERVNTFIEERVPAFNRKLDQAGVRPDPGKPITLPRRSGG
jgi:photosystem II stability/assembly factor-like uncharacterized protein